MQALVNAATSAEKRPEPPTTRTQEVLPNTAPPGKLEGSEKLDPMDLLGKQKAQLDAETAKNKMLLDRLTALEEREAKKRKREEEEEQNREKEALEVKRGKFISLARAKLEDIERNSAGGVSKEHIDAVKQQIMGQLNAAKTAAELDAVGAQSGTTLALAHAASATGRKQREENQQAELRQYAADLNARLAETGPSGAFSVSGGVKTDFSPHTTQGSVIGANLSSQPLPGDQGTVNASKYNIFGDLGGTAMAANNSRAPAGRTTVQEIVRPSGESSSGTAAAPAGVDLNAPNWTDQLTHEYVESTSRPSEGVFTFPGESYFRAGGVERKTRFVASENGGPARAETYVQARRTQPLTGPLHMGIMDPVGFKQMVEGINAAKRVGGAARPDLAHCIKLGELNDSGKPKHMEPFRGPIPEDKLKSVFA